MCSECKNYELGMCKYWGCLVKKNSVCNAGYSPIDEPVRTYMINPNNGKDENHES